jgi:hypothetical protein
MSSNHNEDSYAMQWEECEEWEECDECESRGLAFWIRRFSFLL